MERNYCGITAGEKNLAGVTVEKSFTVALLWKKNDRDITVDFLSVTLPGGGRV